MTGEELMAAVEARGSVAAVEPAEAAEAKVLADAQKTLLENRARLKGMADSPRSGRSSTAPAPLTTWATRGDFLRVARKLRDVDGSAQPVQKR